MKNKKTSSESLSVQTKMVLPHDTNPLNTLFGGSLLAWMDEIASIAAHKHSDRVVVTASINNVSFTQPIFAGEIVTLEAKVSRAYNSSMEVFVDVFVENSNGKRKKCNEAIYNFVAIDQNRSPINIPVLSSIMIIKIMKKNGMGLYYLTHIKLKIGSHFKHL